MCTCEETCESVWPPNAKSPGQTDRQEVASGRKLNLRRDLSWVAKRTRKFPGKYTQVAKKDILRQTIYPLFHWLVIGEWTLLNLRWLGLGGQTVKDLRRRACKFDLDQSERKSSQVNASARKPWPNGVESRRKLKTWVYLRFRLARALNPGQTESQVDSSWKFGSTCDSVWPGLACTCVDLRWRALNLVEIKFARKPKQVFHRLATQPKSTQVEWRPLTYYWPMK